MRMIKNLNIMRIEKEKNMIKIDLRNFQKKILKEESNKETENQNQNQQKISYHIIKNKDLILEPWI